MTRILLLLALAAGCTKSNPEYLSFPYYDFSFPVFDLSVPPGDLAGADLAQPRRDLSVRPDLSRTDLSGGCGLCFDPPPNECLDFFTLRSYDVFGTCVGNQCEYDFTDSDCTNGCDSGACITDSCTGVTCNTPPANYCDTSTSRVVYQTPGSCSSGQCDYSSFVEDCFAPDHGTPTCTTGFCSFKCETGYVKSGSSCVLITCGGVTPNKCGNSCVNLLTDESNCGFCGSFCSGTCNGGVCSLPWPNACMTVPPAYSTCNAYCASVGRTCTTACSSNGLGSYGRYFDTACTQTNTFTTTACDTSIQWSSSIMGIRCCCQ